MTVYSIGYGGRCGAEVAELLSRFSITHLVDVRTSPYSRFDEDFSRNSLELVTQKWGVRYIFLGEALGGRPNCGECYDEEGHVLYDQVRVQEFYLVGIRHVLVGAVVEGRRLCLLCSERKPEDCHRSKLIGETLVDFGVDVQHIVDEGTLVNQRTVMERIGAGQMNLFGNKQVTSRKTYGGKANR